MLSTFTVLSHCPPPLCDSLTLAHIVSAFDAVKGENPFFDPEYIESVLDAAETVKSTHCDAWVAGVSQDSSAVGSA